ncbi:MAG: hypothetical protein K0S39_5156 [Paenibacillus sp.]|nr:hypothetical protein [Paenibacillus sp.]
MIFRKSINKLQRLGRVHVADTVGWLGDLPPSRALRSVRILQLEKFLIYSANHALYGSEMKVFLSDEMVETAINHRRLVATCKYR